MCSNDDLIMPPTPFPHLAYTQTSAVQKPSLLVTTLAVALCRSARSLTILGSWLNEKLREFIKRNFASGFRRVLCYMGKRNSFSILRQKLLFLFTNFEWWIQNPNAYQRWFQRWFWWRKNQSSQNRRFFCSNKCLVRQIV